MAGVALVVGASSGLGRAVARRLAAEGYRTYAGARSFASAQAGGKTPPEGCIPLPLDVTDDASVSAAVRQVLDAEGRIDALINCAAVICLGACEEVSADELSAVMETNLLGTARVIRAVLPAMRAQGAGRIVQFSSLNGRFGIPFQGAYAASKHAVEGFCEALAMEVRRLGISVTIVEPGDCRSGSDAYRRRAQAAETEASPYRPHYLAATERIHQDESTGLPAQKVAHAVAKALKKRRPPARMVVASFTQRVALWAHTLLPGRWFYHIIEAYYAPKKKGSTDPPARRQE